NARFLQALARILHRHFLKGLDAIRFHFHVHVNDEHDEPPSLQSKPRHAPPLPRLAVCPVEMQAVHPELYVEPWPYFRSNFFFQGPWEISVKETQVGHKGRFARMSKNLASHLMRLPQRLRERHVNEEAAKVFVAEVDLTHPKDKGTEGGGDARGPANQLPPRTHT